VTAATIPTPHVDWLALSPDLALLAAAGIALLSAVLVPEWCRHVVSATVAAAGFVAAGAFACVVFDRTPQPVGLIADTMTRDRWGALAQVIVAAGGLVAVLVAWGAGRRRHVAEYYALLAAAGGGMAFFVQSASLLTLFLGLEWFSIALYVLCALDSDREQSLEAGLKYLIIGSFGSAILLFGSALVYGATGTLGFAEIASAGKADDPLLVGGLALILTGMAFKASAAPFHMWTPDVYEGAPTPVTAFMSAATKVAAFAALLRILTTAFPDNSDLWTIATAVLACASLAVGNLAALAQKNLKRMLAYSSVSHAGFMLIAVAANNALGGRALLYYLIPYGATALGAFAVVAARERELQADVTLDAMAGFGWERPFYGAAMWVFMLGAAGFPLTGGFLAKFYVFSAAYEAGWWWLVVVGVIATFVSLYYYLGVVRAMYMRPSQRGEGTLRVAAVAGGSPPRDAALAIGVGVSLAVTIGSFFFVSPLIRLAREAAASLFA
jgi:NADH-quinone oxidoreductase subunit N